MVPGVGIEPTTLSSSGLRSTTELPRHIYQIKEGTIEIIERKNKLQISLLFLISLSTGK
jgi:hypothetical protein